MQSSSVDILPTGDYIIDIQEIDYYSGFKTSLIVDLKVRDLNFTFNLDSTQTASQKNETIEIETSEETVEEEIDESVIVGPQVTIGPDGKVIYPW